MKRVVIYVPGIRDDWFKAQSFLLWFWRFRGVKPICHEMPWSGNEPYEAKVDRLLAQIDHEAAAGYKISLLGASAGASAVLNAYAARRESITGVVLICAKINLPDSVSKHTYDQNPAFKTSLQELQKLLPRLTAQDKSKILSIYSPVDTSVPHADTIIPGVREVALRPLSHGQAILYSISWDAQTITDFLKSIRS